GLPLAWFGIFASASLEAAATASPEALEPLAWTPSIDRDAYSAAIDRIRTHIADGDTYQLNFTFRLAAKADEEPRALFERLIAAQHGEWSASVDIGTHAICSASPELFFRIDDGRIECRPMKGTMPRGLWAEDDRAQGERLRQSPKNRSENVMIVDLMRNDL